MLPWRRVDPRVLWMGRSQHCNDERRRVIINNMNGTYSINSLCTPRSCVNEYNHRSIVSIKIRVNFVV